MSKLVIWINFNKYTYFNYPDWDSMTWHHTKESHNHGIPWNSKPLPYIYQCFLKLFVKDDISLHQTRGFCLDVKKANFFLVLYFEHFVNLLCFIWRFIGHVPVLMFFFLLEGHIVFVSTTAVKSSMTFTLHQCDKSYQCLILFILCSMQYVFL